MPGQECQLFYIANHKTGNKTTFSEIPFTSQIILLFFCLNTFLLCVFLTGHMLHHVNIGLKVKQCVHQIPSVTMEASIQPITRTVLRVTLSVCPDFTWNDQVKVEIICINGKQNYLCCRFKYTSLHLSKRHIENSKKNMYWRFIWSIVVIFAIILKKKNDIIY